MRDLLSFLLSLPPSIFFFSLLLFKPLCLTKARLQESEEESDNEENEEDEEEDL